MGTPGAFFKKFLQLLGYYLPGDSPTIIIPCSLSHSRSEITNIHEQTHRDLMTNTLYGFVLSSLRELSQLRDVSATEKSSFDKSVRMLSNKIRLPAEGEATAIEILATAQLYGLEAADEIRRKLQGDYRRGFDAILPLIENFGGAFYQRDGVPYGITIVQAVVEYAVDNPFLHVDPLPADFFDLIPIAENASPCDEQALQGKVQLFSRIDLARLDRAKRELLSKVPQRTRAGTQDTRDAAELLPWVNFLRALTDAIKLELFVLEFPSKVPPQFMLHDEKSQFFGKY